MSFQRTSAGLRQTAPGDAIDQCRLTQIDVDETTDATGRTTKSLDFDLQYDPMNKLVGVFDAAGDPVELYAYDARGRLSFVNNLETGAIDSFGYDGTRMVISYNDEGLTFVKWLTFIGPNLDQILEYYDNDLQPFIPLLDHRNSVVGAWDMSQGTMVGLATYDEEGRAILLAADEAILCNEVGNPGVNCLGPANMPFAFTGRWRSSTTGFVNMRNRWYSPACRICLSFKEQR